MKPIRHLPIRKSVAVATALAALLAPTAAFAYPIIGDEPDQAAGQAWMAAHKQTTKVKPDKRRSGGSKPRLCPHSKTAGTRCVKG